MEVLGTQYYMWWINDQHTHSWNFLWATLYDYEINEGMHEIINGVSSRDNCHTNPWLRSRQEISDIFCYPSQHCRLILSVVTFHHGVVLLHHRVPVQHILNLGSVPHATKAEEKGKCISWSWESHLTVDPFALAGALGGTKESPSAKCYVQFKFIKCSYLLFPFLDPAPSLTFE